MVQWEKELRSGWKNVLALRKGYEIGWLMGEMMMMILWASWAPI